GPFCSANFPIATSIIPPLAAFFMKVLYLAVSEEFLPAGVSCAAATPARLSAAIARERIQNCEITLILVFMVFCTVEICRDTPAIKKSQRGACLDADELRFP